MDIQTIETEKDYDQALTEVEKLWGSKQCTPDGDKLDALIVLVEDYENKQHPINPPNPTGSAKSNQSPFDVEGVNLGISTQDIVSAVRESRGRSYGL